MMPTIADIAITLGQSPELSLVVKMTVATALGLAVVRLARASRASVRHLVLTSTFAALLALPVAMLIVPAIAIELTATSTITENSSSPGAATADAAEAAALGAHVGAPVNANGSAARLDTAGNGDGARQHERAAGAEARSGFIIWLTAVGRATGLLTAASADDGWLSRASWLGLVRAIWLTGAALFLGTLTIGLLRMRVLRRTGLPWLERRDEVARVAAEAGVNRPVTLLLHERIVAPLTCGSRNPVIMFPADAREWSDGDVRRTLLHELEHVRRGDWIVQLAARATCAVYWFHPLVWMAWRQLCLEAERACDDAVVRSEVSTDYAEQLVLLARRMADAPAQPILAMANRSDLSTRVTAVLDEGQRRGRAGVMTFVTAAGAAAFLVFTIAPLRAVAGDRSDQQTARAVTADDGGQGSGAGAGRGAGSGAGRGAGRGADVGAALGADVGATTGAAAGSAMARALGEAFIQAASEGDLKAIQELLAAGLDVNLKVDGDGSPLIAASRKGHLAAMKLLMERGADVNMGVNGDGNPLIMAAAEGRVDAVTLLLERGADVDLVIDGDENALIQASGNGHLEVVKLLVARGANVNARVRVEMMFNGKPRTEDRTPLGMARRGRHAAVVAFLQSAGAID